MLDAHKCGGVAARNKVADRRVADSKKKRQRCTFPPRAGALLFGREFSVVVPCNADPHAVFSASCYVAAVLFHFKYFFHFFFVLFRKCCFRSLDATAQNAHRDFILFARYNEAENELAGCTDTHSHRHREQNINDLRTWILLFLLVSCSWSVCVSVKVRVCCGAESWESFASS